MYEDTANRRVLGGTSRRFILHLIPMSRPEVVMSSGTAALFHAVDFSLVTQQNPARAGEVLVARATGLGPVRAPIDPGEPFPADPIAVVNSPIEATVNGGPADVINQVGWPGTRDVYRIDFRVPEGTGAGLATLRLTAAWIPGPQMQFPVR
ncbi:MAG: hypothetical protein HY238_04075 [Acidobacteria bacterium]|nr:hypothetical protein [Acidobacteriota bacterium]